MNLLFCSCLFCSLLSTSLTWTSSITWTSTLQRLYSFVVKYVKPASTLQGIMYGCACLLNEATLITKGTLYVSMDRSLDHCLFDVFVAFLSCLSVDTCFLE